MCVCVCVCVYYAYIHTYTIDMCVFASMCMCHLHVLLRPAWVVLFVLGAYVGGVCLFTPLAGETVTERVNPPAASSRYLIYLYLYLYLFIYVYIYIYICINMAKTWTLPGCV